jgi:hypothetical protein
MPVQSVYPQLEPLLPAVRKPIQYVGGELNSVVKDWDAAEVRWALMYPDAYEVGVPNQGVQILYEVLNGCDGVLAERTYSVWPDLEQLMRVHQVPQFTVDAHRPVRAFDVLGVSFATELGYTNLLTALDLAGIPLSAAERPIPVGVVSHTYSLASHRDVAALCRWGVLTTDIEPDDLRYEVGLSELGEWMNFRIYFPDSYSFSDAHDNKLDLRLECFNSVDGSSRLVILFGWYRLICSNGLVIGETKIEISERHGQQLDLASIPNRIQPALIEVEADRQRMKKWQVEKVAISDIKSGLTIVYRRNGKEGCCARLPHLRRRQRHRYR